jgi:hypothetical protein
MAPFTVGSSIPEAVQNSIDSGVFERVGGVIREAFSGRVIALLRESVNTDTLAPLLTTSGAAALGVLNLSLATMGFAVVLKRIGSIQHRLQQTQDTLTKLDQKIDLSFFANLCAALDLAHDAFTLVRPENRESAARQSVDRLAEARHYYSAIATSTLNASGPAVDAYLATLTLTSVAEARCYLELEELNRASQRLKTALTTIQPHVRGHVTTLLTSNPAAYLHPALKGRVDLARFTKVLNWLTPGIDENAVFEQQRSNFVQLVKGQDTWTQTLPSALWDPKFDPQTESSRSSAKGFATPEVSFTVPKLGHIEVPSWRVKIPSLGKSTDSPALERLPAVMDTMEGMIEDMRRFEGYCAEVETIEHAGVSFHEWQSLAAASREPLAAGAVHYVQLQPPVAGV